VEDIFFHILEELSLILDSQSLSISKNKLNFNMLSSSIRKLLCIQNDISNYNSIDNYRDADAKKFLSVDSNGGLKWISMDYRLNAKYHGFFCSLFLFLFFFG
jgi:hypothetical protein